MDRPSWTARLAHVEQRTEIERQAAALKASIERLGGHPLLTDALNAADLAMCTLGKWHDEGEPGAAPRPRVADGGQQIVREYYAKAFPGAGGRGVAA
jgi:hypothetical protein